MPNTVSLPLELNGVASLYREDTSPIDDTHYLRNVV